MPVKSRELLSAKLILVNKLRAMLTYEGCCRVETLQLRNALMLKETLIALNRPSAIFI